MIPGPKLVHDIDLSGYIETLESLNYAPALRVAGERENHAFRHRLYLNIKT